MIWVKNGLPLRILLIGVFSTALVMAGGCGRQGNLPAKTKDCLEEIMSVQSGFWMLTPNQSVTRLAFARDIGPGRRLFICELNTLVTRQIPGTNDITQIYGWSPDDRFLAFAQSPPMKAGNDDGQKIEWVTVFDSVTGQINRMGTNDNVIEANATWIPDGLFYSKHKIGTDYTEKFIVDPVSGPVKKVRNNINGFTLMGTNIGVVFNNGNLQSCLLDTTNYPPISTLSDFAPDRFDQMRWLRYQDRTGTFLFCAREKESEWRCLYEFSPAKHDLRQLTFGNTYNGQYLDHGFAYVENTNNEFYLAVRPAAPMLATNLFRNGDVITYAVAADGIKLYAVASLGTEPPGIWEYNVASQSLRCLIPGQKTNWKSARLTAPQSYKIRSFDGLEIPYFVVPPVALANLPSNKKFPVILYLPPVDSQFKKAFDLPAQFYANLNCWYVAVNYRGGDGYGKTYSEYQSGVDAAHDALMVLEKVAQNTNVDMQKVILSSESGGAAEVLELLKQSPEKWSGAILHHPKLESATAEMLPSTIPPLFIVAGDLERFLPGMLEFKKSADEKDLPIQILIQKNCGHVTWSTDQIKKSLLEELKFFKKVTR